MRRSAMYPVPFGIPMHANAWSVVLIGIAVLNPEYCSGIISNENWQCIKYARKAFCKSYLINKLQLVYYKTKTIGIFFFIKRLIIVW